MHVADEKPIEAGGSMPVEPGGDEVAATDQAAATESAARAEGDPSAAGSDSPAAEASLPAPDGGAEPDSSVESTDPGSTHDGVPALPNREGKYQRIPLHALRVDTLTEFSIYIRQVDGTFILYRDAQLVFNEEHRQKLLQTAPDGVYIAIDDNKLYVRYLEENLASIIADPNVPPEEESTIVYACASQLLKELLMQPGEREGVNRAVRMVDNAMEHILKGAEYFTYVLEKMSFDYHTYTHSVNVCVFGLALGQRLGFDRDELHVLGQGLLLHDVGKANIDEAILSKPGPLTEAEWEVMRRHPDEGAEILEAAGGVPPLALDVVRQHHEKCTGMGYPRGLDDSTIHVYAKICALVDVFDALTTERPYKQAMNAFPALRIMQSEMPHDFHPNLFREFIRMLGTSTVKHAARKNLHRRAA
jgi:HD-GYP domain-containing protein (c-di-GMP phosphodiesterase class II)